MKKHLFPIALLLPLLLNSCGLLSLSSSEAASLTSAPTSASSRSSSAKTSASSSTLPMPDTEILPSDFSDVANDMVTVNGMEFACEGMKRVQHTYYTGSPKTVDVTPMDVIEMPKDCLFSNRDDFLITTIEVFYLALYADSLADNPPNCFLGAEESPSTLKAEPALNQKEELSAAPMPWVHQVDFRMEKEPQPFFSLINDDSGNNGPLYIVRIEINIALA